MDNGERLTRLRLLGEAGRAMNSILDPDDLLAVAIELRRTDARDPA